MHVFMKVRIKELAEEARIIRSEERKAKAARETSKLNELHNHRVRKVRPAARCVLLAYGFCRGRSYASMEGNAVTSPDWREVKRLICRYGEMDKDSIDKDLERWRLHR